MLGYMGHADWHDMSEYVVHLTKRTSVEEIFKSATIEARTHTGTARNVPDGIGDSQMSVCLSEIPLGHLDRLTSRRGAYGIGFFKEFIETQGGQMVTYLPKGSPAAARFKRLVSQAMRDRVQPGSRINREHPLWAITQFVDNPGEYGDTATSSSGNVNGASLTTSCSVKSMWRCCSPLRRTHDWMRGTAWGHLATSKYMGLVLDPRWDIDRIQHELAISGSA